MRFEDEQNLLNTENEEQRESTQEMEDLYPLEDGGNVENAFTILEPEKPPREKRRFNWKLGTTALISALIGGILSSYIFPVYVFGNLLPYPDNYFGKDVKQVINVESQDTTSLISAVAKKAMPSVVGITTETVQQDLFFGARKSQGVGTGVVVDHRGYILTNSHVVNNGSVERVNVVFHDGTNKEAKILWNDPSLDLAVIKVDGVNVTPADLGNSDNIEVGEAAIAIGNPLGMQFERTVTSGIISGLERSIEISANETIENLIQTDASINPGNSGGPLLNSKGEVIGINTAKIQSGEGLGFAIPINLAKPIVDQFIEKGEFSKVYLGIKGVNVDVFENATRTQLAEDKGVYVVEISKDSPAAKAGLTAGDVIVGINDQEIGSMSQLVRQLYQYRAGDKIDLKIVRNGEEKDLKVALEKVPENY
ncbi:S1-C subfamily serine protease [Anaerosolibacter carboniphilus]|uniref:S1-C subfamily serine protease n=1 Tax=Anaerosolibacter carboniphilus TaxID=1417629 RepID=A0A841KTN5_9FIRM|nr:trypsin-like peptidase domain-containing protein [Anaerosolibacter carboniphilus]MBB6216743.1 S1-C subfamily serine protease [Anaerosolibacter carboniphilus]